MPSSDETDDRRRGDRRREDFCGACAAVPLAVAGLGAGGVFAPAGTGAAAYERRRSFIVLSSAFSAVVSIAALLYLSSSRCDSCLAPP